MKKDEIVGRVLLGIFSIAFLTIAAWSVTIMVMMSESYNYSGHKLILQKDLSIIEGIIETQEHKFNNIASPPINNITEYNDGYLGIRYHFYSREPNILDLKYSKDSPGDIALMGLPLLMAGGLGTVFAIGAIKRSIWDESE